MKRQILWVLIVLTFAAGAAPATAREHHHRDSDFAREALRRGEVLPVERVLALARQNLPGDVIEVRLERRSGGALNYEIRVLTPSGLIRDLVLDARTGAFVKIED